MKKLVSFILFFVLLLSVTLTPIFAQTNESEYLYKDKFIEYNLQSHQELFIYHEMYYHEDASGEIDWIFIQARSDYQQEMPVDVVLADVYIHLNSTPIPFSLGYCIYDVKKDKFFGLGYYDEYEGAEEYINKHIGIPLGDADMDGELTILDATFIQLAIAQLCKFDENDFILSGDIVCGYLSDFDRDGERTILDATAIQLKLAGLD